MAPKKETKKKKGEEVVEEFARSIPIANEVEGDLGSIRVRIGKVNLEPQSEDIGLWFAWKVPNIKVKRDEDVVESVQGRSEIVECINGDFLYQGCVEPVPLTNEFMAMLATPVEGDLELEAFVGEHRDPELDQCVGKVRIGLDKLLGSEDGQYSTEIVVLESSKSEGEEHETEATSDEAKQDTSSLLLSQLKVAITLEADDSLRQFCQGSKILSLANMTLKELPMSWVQAASAPGNSFILELDGQAVLSGPVEIIEVEDEGQEKSCFDDHDDQEEDGEEDGVTETREKTKIVRWVSPPKFNSAVFLSGEVVDKLLHEPNLLQLQCKASPLDEEAAEKNLAIGTLDLSALLVVDRTSSDIELRMQIERKQATIEQGEGETEGEETNSNKQPPVTIEGALSVSLLRPLICSEAPPKPTLRLPREIIEARPPRKMKKLSGEEMLDQTVDQIANMVADEFSQMIFEIKTDLEQREMKSPTSMDSPVNEDGNFSGGGGSDDPARNASTRQAKLLFQLSTNGKYQTIREKLKQAISKYVSESRKSFHVDNDIFIAQVYERVMGLIHRALNLKIEAAKRNQSAKLSYEEAHGQLQQRLSYLKARADDALIANDFATAEKLYQERVGEAEKASLEAADYDLPVDSSVWSEYGMICFQRGEEYHGIAAECFRSAIAIDDSHIPSLVAYGALLAETTTGETQAEDDGEEQVEVFLHAGCGDEDVSLNPETNEHIYYLTGHGILSLLSNRLATTDQCNYQFVVGKALNISVDESNVALAIILSHAASQCITWNLPNIARRLFQARMQLLQDQIELDDNAVMRRARYVSKLLEGRLEGTGNRAIELLTQAVDLEPTRPESRVLLVNSSSGLDELEKCFDLWLESTKKEQVESEDDVAAVWNVSVPEMEYRKMLTLLGNRYLSKRDGDHAKQVFLHLCERWPTPRAWIGVGLACIELTQYEEAVDALSEANIIDRLDPETWGYLALACQYIFQHEHKAKFAQLSRRALNQAMKLDLCCVKILHQLGSSLAATGQLDLAEKLLEKALQIEERQMDAKMEFANVLILQNKHEKVKPIIAELRQNLGTEDSPPGAKVLLHQYEQSVAKWKLTKQ